MVQSLLLDPEFKTSCCAAHGDDANDSFLLVGGEGSGKTLALREQLRFASENGDRLFVIGRYHELDVLAAQAGDDGKLVTLTPEQVSTLAEQGRCLTEPTSVAAQRRQAFETLKDVAGEFYPPVTVFDLPWIEDDSKLTPAIETLLCAAWHLKADKTEAHRHQRMVVALDALHYPMRTRMAKHMVMWGARARIAFWLVSLPHSLDTVSPFLWFATTLALFRLPNGAMYHDYYPHIARVSGIRREDDLTLSTSPVGTAWVRRFGDRDNPVIWYRANI